MSKAVLSPGRADTEAMRARVLFGQIEDRVGVWLHEYSRGSALECVTAALAAAHAEGVKEERERCAIIAETEMSRWGPPLEGSLANVERHCVTWIAATIRGQP